MLNKKIKVLYLGNFQWDLYPRGRILYEGLCQNNIDVELLTIKKIRDYFLLVIKLLKRDYDLILVTGKIIVLISIFLKFIHKKKIIFDVFISDYENLVLNRKVVHNNSIKAFFLFFLDKYCCIFSDLNILDTIEHIEYYSKFFKVNKQKFKEILIGADEKVFYPKKKVKHNKFIVLFWGTFIPGHGIEHIIYSAEILKKKANIEFYLIGNGPLHQEMVNLSNKLNLKNIYFLGWKNLKELPKEIAKADVCLGLFDNKISKVKRVIPTKVFEILAMKKPLITGKNKCVGRYLINSSNALLCNMGSSKDLANCIIKIFSNNELRKKIAKNGYEVYNTKFNTLSIGKKLTNEIKKLI